MGALGTGAPGMGAPGTPGIGRCIAAPGIGAAAGVAEGLAEAGLADPELVGAGPPVPVPPVPVLLADCCPGFTAAALEASIAPDPFDVMSLIY